MTTTAASNHVTDETLATLKAIPTQTLIDGLWVMGWPMSMIEGAKPLQPGQHMAGRAVTLRFVPHRPDLASDKPKGIRLGRVRGLRVVRAGRGAGHRRHALAYSSIGGDIKFYRLYQRGVGGLVTDGAVRDTNTLKEYGFPVYSANATAKQGPAEFWPWQVNDCIQCSGVLVRPGDAIVGDDDGVVVVPASAADEVIQIAHQREEVEAVIKAQLEIEQCSPGKYYPFNDNTWNCLKRRPARSLIARLFTLTPPLSHRGRGGIT